MSLSAFTQSDQPDPVWLPQQWQRTKEKIRDQKGTPGKVSFFFFIFFFAHHYPVSAESKLPVLCALQGCRLYFLCVCLLCLIGSIVTTQHSPLLQLCVMLEPFAGERKCPSTTAVFPVDPFLLIFFSSTLIQYIGLAFIVTETKTKNNKKKNSKNVLFFFFLILSGICVTEEKLKYCCWWITWRVWNGIVFLFFLFFLNTSLSQCTCSSAHPSYNPVIFPVARKRGSIPIFLHSV